MLRRKIKYLESEPTTYASIVPDAGAVTRQVYSTATGAYYPERSVAPLALNPTVGYELKDTGEAVDNAAPKLTDGHWYRLTDGTTGGLTAANEITNGMKVTAPDGTQVDRYTIDTTVGSPTYGRILIRENTPVSSPVTYVFVATLNVGSGVKLMKSFRSDTKGVTVMPEIQFDNDPQALYNPWQDGDTFTITPSITPSSYTATFAWKTMHGTAWGALGSTHYDWALSVNAATGALTINRKQMQDEINLKCVAQVNIDGLLVEIERMVTHQRRLPKFEAEVRHIADILPTQKTIAPKLHVESNKMEITDPAGELLIPWYGQGATPVAYGANPTIHVSALGTAMELGVDPKDRGGWKALEDGSGNYLVTSDGKQIIAR